MSDVNAAVVKASLKLATEYVVGLENDYIEECALGLLKTQRIQQLEAENERLCEAVHTAESLSEWIAVEDRLPETDDTVIVRGETPMDHWQPVWHDADSYAGGDWGGCSSDDYTHWMPIPPQEEG